jgi:putative N6-adenine-specific DNA methylase
MEKTETLAALCAVGAEKVVSNELKKMGLKVEESLYGRVRFRADTKGLYQSLIGLRAADRVLLEIAYFKATDFDALFEGTASAVWERIVPKDYGLKVTKVRTNRSQLKAETSIQAVVHKAAAQRLCGKYKVSRLAEDGKMAEVRVYIEKDMVYLLVDLCGEPLFKRGYRSEGGSAPLRETTAASILLLSGWKRKFPLYDPFCGSGTILFEAAMYAWDMAPGLGRRFAVEDLLIADNKVEQSIREEFRGKIDFSRLIRIAGSDEDTRSISIAESNAERLRDIAEGRPPQKGIRAAGKTPGIELKKLSLDSAASTFSDTGFLVTNPPYGKRLGDQTAAEQTYQKMGDLKQRFPGWKLAVITDNSGFESFYGKKADSCREISNGSIPSYFFQYDII